MHKRALTALTTDSSLSGNNVFRDNHVLSFWSLRNYKISLVINNIVNTNSPFPLSLFTLPSRSTRQASNFNFNLPKCNNVYGERLIEFSGVKIWNDLPIEVKSARNFKMATKQHYKSSEILSDTLAMWIIFLVSLFLCWICCVYPWMCKIQVVWHVTLCKSQFFSSPPRCAA